MKSLSFFLKYARVLTKRDLDEFLGLDVHRSGSIFPNGNESNFLWVGVRHFCEDGRTYVSAWKGTRLEGLQY